MKVLGLDLGTNSIGWGIVDESAKKIEKCGVYVFPEGVKIEKGNESSKAAERTGYRSARRIKFRRKLRKYETLKVLIQNEMCPLSMEELEKWRNEKIYPTSEEFTEWFRTDEKRQWEPYYLRKKCVEGPAEKQEIGRALYHIAQRRGFLSNRKDTTEESNGKVSEQIDEISQLKGDKTLGQYFFDLKQNGEKVRGKYTSRKAHYEEEFNRICEVQSIPEALRTDLYKAIFYQRKLKSQKFLVGKCTLEPDKPRCPISHYKFEEFRMLSFINSITVERNVDEDDSQEKTPLTQSEKELIIPLFFRLSKPNFTFLDILANLNVKNRNGKSTKKCINEHWKFNYREETNVPGCPVSAGLKTIFGDNWKDIKIGQYDIDDIWHVLFDFDDDERLHEFALNKLHLNEEQIKKFCDIHIQQGYANLSLKAINKIIPFLQKGYVYSHAVFLANIPTMIGKDVYDSNAKDIEDSVKEIIAGLRAKNDIITIANHCIEAIFKDKEHDFRSEDWNKKIIDDQIVDLYGKKKWAERSTEEQKTIKSDIESMVDDALRIAVTRNPNDYKYPALRTDDLIIKYLESHRFAIKKNSKLYHPSDTEYNFEDPKLGDDGKLYLGSPRTPSVKNPVVMRALHQLRKLINYLIQTGEVDSSTHVNIELANEVNDKNWRKAIEEFQRDNQKKNEEYRKAIVECCKDAGFNIVPTDKDILKYRLWKEQNELCPYTGKKIGITDLFGPHPKFDFEHTIPRSLSYDDSMENLTLCDSDYNRNVKKQHIPSELKDFEDIKARFEGFYTEKIDKCLETIERNKIRGGYLDPAVKDKKIVARHKAQLELDYYKGKIRRFIAPEVTSGFKNSQLNDTRIITKFALSYLKSIFGYVQPVKGSMTDTFKRQWGLLDKYEDKNRSNYQHHAVDAITVACINRGKFNLLSEAIRNSADGIHLNFAKPWESFDTEVLSAVQYIIPKHFTDDNALRQTKKLLRDREGRPVLKNGRKVYIQGNTARGSLHLDTFYGCIKTPPEKGKESQQIFVQRVSCAALTKDSADKIIDKGIRKIFIDNLNFQKQDIADIQKNGILLPYKNSNGKDLYVRKIRIKAKTTNPVILKSHNNSIKNSHKDYKQKYYVVNEENYLIALYRGKNVEGKSLSSRITLNLLEAIKNKQQGLPLYPFEYDGLKLYKVLKVGKFVILQQYIDEDVLELPKEQIWSRMYRIAGLAKSGNAVQIKLSQVSSSNPWHYIAGTYPLDSSVEFRLYQDSRFIGLVEGEDFIITPTGEIIKK